MVSREAGCFYGLIVIFAVALAVTLIMDPLTKARPTKYWQHGIHRQGTGKAEEVVQSIRKFQDSWKKSKTLFVPEWNNKDEKTNHETHELRHKRDLYTYINKQNLEAAVNQEKENRGNKSNNKSGHDQRADIVETKINQMADKSLKSYKKIYHQTNPAEGSSENKKADSNNMNTIKNAANKKERTAASQNKSPNEPSGNYDRHDTENAIKVQNVADKDKGSKTDQNESPGKQSKEKTAKNKNEGSKIDQNKSSREDGDNDYRESKGNNAKMKNAAGKNKESVSDQSKSASKPSVDDNKEDTEKAEMDGSNKKISSDDQQLENSKQILPSDEQIPEKDQKDTDSKLKQSGMETVEIPVKVKHKLWKDIGQNLTIEGRAHLVNHRCLTFSKENNITDNVLFRYEQESLLVSKKYELAICASQKVGSTNIKRMLYALDNDLTGRISYLSEPVVRKYAQTRQRSLAQLESVNRELTSVMIVREPLERILSAYRDGRSFQPEFENSNFTFTKYLELILQTDTLKLNKHIYPFYEKCRPCDIQYDYVALQSTFTTNMRTVLRKIGAKGKVLIPRRESSGYMEAPTADLLKTYFKAVPHNTVHKLWEKYYKDYYIFGFPYPSHLMF